MEIAGMIFVLFVLALLSVRFVLVNRMGFFAFVLACFVMTLIAVWFLAVIANHLDLLS